MFEFTLPMGDAVQLWSEFNPTLYRLTVNFEGKSKKAKITERKDVNFGMRKFHTIGTSFAINGHVLSCGETRWCVFPQAGYPPMDETEWIRILT
jgi:hypothetical protein